MRILYLQASFVPPPVDPQLDRFQFLSETLEGDVLQPVWFSTPAEVEAEFGPGSYPVYTRGRFRYHWFLSLRYRGVWQRLATFRFYLRKARELHRQQPFQCIVAYSHMTTGLMGVLAKWLTGAKLVVEIVTSPPQVYLAESPHPGWREKIMHFYSDLCLHLSSWGSDRMHCLYPDLYAPYPLLRNTRVSVFHDYVTASRIDRAPDAPAELFVLLAGAPWFLKGVDLLVEAFQRLAPDFPDWRLKLLGFYPPPGRAGLEALVAGHPRIEILAARPNPEALRIIAQSSILVLASRCEGMGRVLIEGMAAGIPLVGSDVGGIPHMIHSGENGLLFPCGDSHALEQCLRTLMGDPALRKQMGQAGYRRAHSELDELAYARCFTAMVKDAIAGAA